MAQTMNLSCCSGATAPVTRRAVPAVARHAAIVQPRAALSRSSTSCQAAPREASASPRVSVTAAAAAEANAPAAPSSTATKEWYALVANAGFFCNDVQNEAVAEQLRERVRFFKEIGREIDFWLVPEPTWLDAKYPELAKKVGRPCVALVSTDEMWITFMKLRLDRVLRINLGAVEQSDALSVGGKIPDFPKPEKWTAPYQPYSDGWWDMFIPK